MDKEFARFIQSRCKFIKIKCKNRAQISIENNSSLSLKAISIYMERENDFSILLLFSISQVFHEFYVFVTNSTASVKRIVTLSCYCSPTTFLLQKKKTLYQKRSVLFHDFYSLHIFKMIRKNLYCCKIL